MTILEYLQTHCDEVSPKDFYRMIFPTGELEGRGVYESGKYNAIAVCIGPGKKVKRFTVTDDLEQIDALQQTDDFCVMAPISYAGRSRKSANARNLYALAIDVDGIKTEDNKGAPTGMVDLFYQFDGHGPSGLLPLPTAIVFSGAGLHLYWILERPVPCFRNIVEQLTNLKRELTTRCWNQYVTRLSLNVQYESLFQGFRMPGTITKSGSRARAFLVDGGKKVSIEYLNRFVAEENRVTEFAYTSKLTREQAKEKYPEWYEKRIVKKEPKGRWTVKRDLYDWWLRTLWDPTKPREGGRYWAIHALVTFAVKCRIDREEVERDALELVPWLDKLTTSEDNHFTEDDVRKALEAYDESYVTYPREVIAIRSKIPIVPQIRRNGRKQAAHLERARAVQKIDYPNHEWAGRPVGSGTKKEVIKSYMREHPEVTKKAVIARELGISRPTIIKYYDEIAEELRAQRELKKNDAGE